MHRAMAVLLSGVALMVGAAAERGPIAILSDADFTAANGVIGGAGTPGDPYLIVGWEIRVSSGDLYGIRIEDTTASFVVRGCRVSGAMDPRGAAIALTNVVGGVVEDCTISDSINGIRIATSRDVTVRDNFLGVRGGLGFQVLGLEKAHFRHAVEPTNTVNGQEIRYYYGLSGQVLEGIAAGHITLAACRNVTLRGAKIDRGDGINVVLSEGVRIENADVSRATGNGVFIFSSPGTMVTDSPRIANCTGAGISVWLSDRVWVENVGLYANQVGLLVNASDGVTARNNAFAANPLGVLVTGGARDTLIQQGLFYQNRHGVEIETSYGVTVERCAFTESDVAVYIEGGATHPRVAYSTMVQVGYGISSLASHGVYERNLIARANIGIIFEEAYSQATPTGNVVRHNVLYRCTDGLYFGTETVETQIYENLVWECGRIARDLGKNLWAPHGRGNWYSNYQGPDADGDGIGDLPVLFGGGGQDAYPLMDRAFYPGLPGVVGTMREQVVTLEDKTGLGATVTARVAALPHERFIGFQGIPVEMAQDLAILFVFQNPTVSQFHMRNVFLPLDIVFFAADGAFLGRNTMQADSKDLYGAADPFTMALEVPAGRFSDLGLAREIKLIPNP